jgi:hypothetical protein
MKHEDEKDDGYWASLSILWQREVRAAWCHRNVAYGLPHAERAYRGACLSKGPLEDLSRLAATRSRYGLGFQQSVMRGQGGRRVKYVHRDSQEGERELSAAAAAVQRGALLDDPVWRDLAFVDVIDEAGDEQLDTSWERERRVPGPLYFTPREVAFLVLPAELHAAA